MIYDSENVSYFPISSFFIAVVIKSGSQEKGKTLRLITSVVET